MLDQLEKKIVISFLFCVITAIFVFVRRFGWQDFLSEAPVYLFMITASIIAYFLIKKSTLMLGNLSLSLYSNDAFRQLPAHVLMLRYKISIYFSLLFAALAYGMGVYAGNDLFVLFSWTILGFTLSSQQLLHRVQELNSPNEIS